MKKTSLSVKDWKHFSVEDCKHLSVEDYQLIQRMIEYTFAEKRRLRKENIELRNRLKEACFIIEADLRDDFKKQGLTDQEIFEKFK